MKTRVLTVQYVTFDFSHSAVVLDWRRQHPEVTPPDCISELFCSYFHLFVPFKLPDVAVILTAGGDKVSEFSSLLLLLPLLSLNVAGVFGA